MQYAAAATAAAGAVAGALLGKIGSYAHRERRSRVRRFYEKRQRRVWSRTIKYDCRKKLADNRPRVKGRFVRSEEPIVLTAAAISAGEVIPPQGSVAANRAASRTPPVVSAETAMAQANSYLGDLGGGTAAPAPPLAPTPTQALAPALAPTLAPALAPVTASASAASGGVAVALLGAPNPLVASNLPASAQPSKQPAPFTEGPTAPAAASGASVHAGSPMKPTA